MQKHLTLLPHIGMGAQSVKRAQQRSKPSKLEIQRR